MAVNRPDPVRNLGHKASDRTLTKNPAGRVINYDSADTARIYRDPSRLQGVYGKCNNPKSGISSEQSLDQWSDYATKDSYHRGPGPGKEPPQSDASRRLVPSEARNKDSDNYLRGTEGWKDFDRGSESGEGRLQRSQKRG